MIKTIFSILKKSLLLSSYAVILFYTIIFPTPVSWVIFYFFTLMLIFLWSTTFALWNKIQFELISDDISQSKGLLKLKTRFYFPVLMPWITVTIGNDRQSFSTRISSYFKRHLAVPFEQVSFDRGKYDTLLIRTSGKDYSGVFAHRSKHLIPVDFSIYPKQLPFDSIYSLLQQLNTRLNLNLLSGHQSAQFRQLREHQAKDSLKDIDWKASFKKQNLMVKEYDKESDIAVTIIFLGYQTEHFEDLLSLAYSLYLELTHYQAVQLKLIGKFGEQVMTKQTKDAFLTIQPAANQNDIDSIWKKGSALPTKTILVSSKKQPPLVKENRPLPFYFINEDTLTDFKIGGI